MVSDVLHSVSEKGHFHPFFRQLLPRPAGMIETNRLLLCDHTHPPLTTTKAVLFCSSQLVSKAVPRIWDFSPPSTFVRPLGLRTELIRPLPERLFKNQSVLACRTRQNNFSRRLTFPFGDPHPDSLMGKEEGHDQAEDQ